MSTPDNATEKTLVNKITWKKTTRIWFIYLFLSLKKKEPEVKHKLEVEQEPAAKHEPEAEHEAKLGEKRKAKGEKNDKSNRRRRRKPDDFRDVDDLDTAQYYFEDGKERKKGKGIIQQPF